METIDKSKEKQRRYAYVSLYGVKSIDEVSKEIVFQYFGKKNEKKVKTANIALQTASSILTASLGTVNFDFSKLQSTIAKININNWIICFDDLERSCLSINEILGYMNRLVEHNNCKVIVLANEKEIGKVTLSQRLEDKYQVVLSGRRLSFDNNSKENNEDCVINAEKLQNETKCLFNEDIMYRSIREKVIGLTIRYDPKMDIVFDSIIIRYSDDIDFKKYLIKNKSNILKCFEKEECCNLRTLTSVLESTQKVYQEMVRHKFNISKHFERIMESFLENIVLLTIFYRNGGKLNELNLTTEIGYVELGRNKFNRIKGFRFLERYCTTLSFVEQEFVRTVGLLCQEYEEEEKRIIKSKYGLAKAYSELTSWWEKEDKEIGDLIALLKKEIKQDKYPFNNYQGIIGQLLVLEYWGHKIGNIDELIELMNHNIESSEEIVDIERNSFSFENNLELRKKYDEYVDRLKLKASNKNYIIKASELSQCTSSDNWAEELLDYCEKHYNEFLARYGFIYLINIETLSNKLQNASTKELYLLIEIFKTVYRAFDIRTFFENDLETIKEFRNTVGQMNVTGINKPLAKKTLEDYLEDVINRLER